MKNSLAKNAIYKVILNLFNLLVPLFVGPYIAGLLNVDLYGAYNRIYAEFSVVLAIGAFGIYNYGMREISKVRNNPQEVNRLFSNLFLIGIASNLLVGVFYVFYFMNRASGVELYVYMVMMIQLVGNMFYIEFVNEAVENYGFITKKTILIRLLYLISIFVFVRKPEDVIPYAIVICMTVFLNNIVSYIYLRKKLRFDFSGLKQIRYQIVPLVVTLLLTNVEILYGQMDKLMLSPVLNDVAVTEYTLPTTLMGMVGTLPLALVSVAIPRLAKYVGEKNERAYTDTLHNTTNIFMAMIIPMSLGVFVLSKEIMWLYSRDVYTYVYPVLMVAALSRIVYAYQAIISNLVMYVNSLEKQLTFFLFIFGVANVAMNGILILIGKFSPTTALITTVIATMLFVIFATLYSRKKLGVHCGFFSKRIRGYLIVSALFVPISFLVHLLGQGHLFNMVVTVALCVALYAAYLFKTKDPLLDFILTKVSYRKKVDKK